MPGALWEISLPPLALQRAVADVVCMKAPRRGRVTAVLGPTNTGKTYLAIERMLGYAGGIMGFPLRLLARENYDKVVAAKGVSRVALITGEEKIVPPNASYFLCTVEAMPLDREAEFLAIDEIQLAADPERGHVFTDRLLHARGLHETMFLGAETIRPLLTRLVPEAETITRPRFSNLSYVGPKKLTRLPPRSAAVAFSAAQVYSLAELIRGQRGGTAVVLGALSPRTRNAQVGMFESGEVDYLVATDAIGMGLNLGLDHVAFASMAKFDGRAPRRLRPAEVAQIAGRAGRHLADGTFGTTAEAGGMEAELVEAVEEHAFDPVTAVYWRNRALDFRSPLGLLRSLEEKPLVPELLRVRPPEDQQALASLARDPEIETRAGDREAVRLLWEVCQIPDFQKILSDQHRRLLARIFHHLRENDGRLPDDWVAAQITRLDRADGDIDILTARIAHVRTWTFISHRADWLKDARHWQEKARAIEDKLSDALHERLTQRFVDRRAAVLVRRMRSGEDLLAAIRKNGEVLVEGEHVGQLEGFEFRLDHGIDKTDARAVLAATRRALGREIPARLARLEADGDGAFRLDEEGRLFWREAEVARLAAGDSPLAPRVRSNASEFLDGRARERLRQRLEPWLTRHLRNRLKPLFALEEAPLEGAARGLAFQVAEALGVIPRSAAAAQIGALGKAERRALAALGLKLGAQSVYLDGLTAERDLRLRGLLWRIFKAPGRQAPPAPVLPNLKPGVFAAPERADESLLHALGFRLFEGAGGGIAIRAQNLERLAFRARKAARTEGGSDNPNLGFRGEPALLKLAGGDANALDTILLGLGYWRAEGEDGTRYHARPLKGARRPGKGAAKSWRPRPAAQAAGKDSPFAMLRQLKLGS